MGGEGTYNGRKGRLMETNTKQWATGILLAVTACLPLLLSAAAQHEHHRAAHHLTAQDVKLEVHEDAATRELTVRLGPLDLPAHRDHHSIAQAPDLFLTIPFDGWFTAYHPRLVGDAGNPLPNKLLHHVAFWNTARSDFLCPRKEEHIFGAGGEMNTWPALPSVGYRVHPGERIRIGTMFHNPTDTSFPKAFLEVRMETKRIGSRSETDPPRRTGLKNVYPVWFDVQECGESGYDLRPGRNVNAGKFSFPYNGTLLGLGGHLHDYGERVVVVNQTRKEEIATLPSKLDPGGLILSMPIVTFIDRGGYRLNKGDVIQVTATYNNPTGHELPEGAMGIAVGYFLPADDRMMSALEKKP